MSILSKLVNSSAKSVKTSGSPPAKQSLVPGFAEGSNVNAEDVHTAGMNGALREDPEGGKEHAGVANAGESDRCLQAPEGIAAEDAIKLEAAEQPASAPLDETLDIVTDGGRQAVEMFDCAPPFQEASGTLGATSGALEERSICHGDQRMIAAPSAPDPEGHMYSRAEPAAAPLADAGAVASHRIHDGVGLVHAEQSPGLLVQCVLEPADDENVCVHFVVRGQDDAS